jgi:hypothetical protein
MSMKLWRRSLLAAAGTTAVGAMLRPLMAHAQAGVAPQRLLLIHRPCGTTLGTTSTMYPNDGRWWPVGGTTGWTASPLLSSFTDGKIASLQNSMVVLKGLSCPRNMNWLGDHHGSGFLGMVTPTPKDVGYNSRPQSTSATPATMTDPTSKTTTAIDQSIDQLFLSQIPALRGSPCPVPSVQLTTSTESADQTYDYHNLRVTSYARGPAGSLPTPLWPEVSPSAAFMNYFASGLMNMSPAQIARMQAQNKSVLDFASAGLSRLQMQAPKSQVVKLQAHLDAIRQLETDLSARAGAACTPPSFAGPPLDPVPSKLDSQHYPLWGQHKEIIKALFVCDITRVISFTFGYGNSNVHFQNVLQDPALVGKYKDTSGNPISDPDGHHEISHNAGGDPNDAQYIIDKYYCDRTAELLAEMSTTPDIGGGTLLDNTLVVFWSEVSNGNSHGAVDMPVVLFGGKFLKLNGGSYLQLGSSSQVPNGHYNLPSAPYMSDFWVTTARAWGYGAMTSYGDSMWNSGPINGIYG